MWNLHIFTFKYKFFSHVVFNDCIEQHVCLEHIWGLPVPVRKKIHIFANEFEKSAEDSSAAMVMENFFKHISKQQQKI